MWTIAVGFGHGFSPNHYARKNMLHFDAICHGFVSYP